MTKPKKADFFQLTGGIKCYVRDPDRTIPGPLVALQVIPTVSSKICRFGGQLGTYYSLAQHVMGVSRRIKVLGGTVAQQLQGLLHDAGEAFLGGDIPTPVRLCITGYDELEETFLNRVMDVFLLPRKIDKLVWQADDEMKVIEAETFLDGGPLDNWTHLYLNPKVDRKKIIKSTFPTGGFPIPWDMGTAEGKLRARLLYLSAAHFIQIEK